MTEDQRRQIDEMLRSAEPPTEPLGETTNYEQVAVAWGKEHRLSLTEFIDRLEAAGGRRGRQLAQKIRQNARTLRLYDIALHSPLHG